MTSAIHRLAIAAVAAGLLATSITAINAQAPADPHHPDGAPAAGTAVPPAKSGAAPSAPMGGMMGGDQMPMMKMMQEMHGKMMGGGMAMQPKGDQGPSSQAFAGISAKMHQAMAVTFTGNADIDFAKAMIPHHQAAVDMAKTVLAFGKDPQVKKVAEGIIKAQEAEIAVFTDWLKKNSK